MRFNKELGEMTLKEASNYLGIAPNTLRKWNIPHLKIGRIVLYRVADIEAWKESQITGGNDETRTSE